MADSSVPKKKMAKQLTGKRDDTPLHSAVRRGNKDEVVEILTKTRESDLNVLLGKQNQSGETALYVAAEYGDVEIVKEMIKCYDLALVEIKARNGFDAFHIAAKQGHLSTCKNPFKSLLKPVDCILNIYHFRVYYRCAESSSRGTFRASNDGGSIEYNGTTHSGYTRTHGSGELSIGIGK